MKIYFFVSESPKICRIILAKNMSSALDVLEEMVKNSQYGDSFWSYELSNIFDDPEKSCLVTIFNSELISEPAIIYGVADKTHNLKIKPVSNSISQIGGICNQ